MSGPAGDGPVTTVATPIKVEYQYTAGLAQSRFLKGIAEGRFLGQRCPACHKVYVPPRGRAPPTAWPPPTRSSWPTPAR